LASWLFLDNDEMPSTYLVSSTRICGAIKVSVAHLLLSLLVAAVAGALVFLVWYPAPYQNLSGGRELFWLVMVVDVICGPLLTAVLFNAKKPRRELWRDLTMVAIIQLGALGYGLHTVWTARPLFLVLEVDRFKVLGRPDLPGLSLSTLAHNLRPSFFSGPVTVAIRDPRDENERQAVLFESLQGGRDYAERPEFYLAYESAAALKALKHAKPLSVFLLKQPDEQTAAKKLSGDKRAEIAEWMYLPVVARQDWVAVLDKQGKIQGFLKGDGF
jgi:hypothetical protein